MMSKNSKKQTVKEPPLAIAISVLISDNKILLIERIKGDYVGLWGLPGGKIEKNEHFRQAAAREVFEESGIESKFENYCGLVSEHLFENGSVSKHFLLHVSRLAPKTEKISNGSEGRLGWFNLNRLDDMKEKIIPSDFLIIEKMVKKNDKNYYECIIEKTKDGHRLIKFE